MFYKETSYKDGEAGRFPYDWSVVRLGDVCGERREIVLPSGKGERFVGLEHVEPGETRLTKYSTDSEVRSSKFEFHAGDILYGRLRPYLDKAVVAYFDGICSTDFIVLRANGQELVTEFLLHLLHSPRLTSHAISTTTGTNHPRTSWNALGNFPFGLPPLAEQRGVAQVLSTVDEAIQKTSEVITKTERLKRGLMQELLTKGIGHKEFKDTEIGRIPSEWTVARLGDYVDLLTGYPFQSRLFSDSGIRLVRGDNITKGFLRWEEKTRYWKSVTPDIEEYLLKGDDVLVSMDGALVGRNFAKVTRGDLPLLLVQRVARLRAINGLNQEFLFYLIQHPRFERHIDSVKTHMAIPHFSPDDLRSYRVPIPDRPAEQRQIAEMLASVDFKLERETISRQHLARLRRGLTDLLLTGKVRIKVS